MYSDSKGRGYVPSFERTFLERVLNGVWLMGYALGNS
jgi:hypothetical protein